MSHRLNVNTAKYLAGGVVASTAYTCYNLRCRQLQLMADEGRLPVVMPRGMPGHFVRALRRPSAQNADVELERLSGLWLAYYGQSAVVHISGGAALTASHVTGSSMVPAGSPAFVVQREPATAQLVGHCTASLLPRGLWLVQRPCRLTVHRGADDGGYAADEAPPIAALTLDMQLASWLPWTRVPMLRIPEDAYIPRDERAVAEAARAVCGRY